MVVHESLANSAENNLHGCNHPRWHDLEDVHSLQEMMNETGVQFYSKKTCIVISAGKMSPRASIQVKLVEKSSKL